jgi:hypothetical protein
MLNGGQEPADLDEPTRARIKRTQRFAVSIGWKVVAIAAIDFLLLRIWAPNLIDMHSDLALLGAVACALVAVAATLWLAFQIWVDVKRFNPRKSGAIHRLKIED